MSRATAADMLEQAIHAMEAGDAARAHELAIELCATAPDDYRYQQIAGIATLSLGESDDALRHFGTAVRLAPGGELAAAAWTGLGRTHLMLENPNEAERAFRRALSLAPRFGGAFAGLAEAVGRLGRHYETEQAANRALELGVKDARLHLALGHAYLGQDKVDDAEAEFNTARTLDPELPDPRFALGSIAKVRGQFAEADRIYREVLTSMPLYPGFDQFAGLKTFTPGDEDLNWLEERFRELPEDAPRSAWVDLHFALSKAYDDVGEADKAIQHLREGNRLERDRMAFDPDADEERMHRIEQLLTRDFIERHAEAGLTGMRPIFIVSLPRSGSTLTEQMLASHSRIRGGGELGHFARVATALGAKWGARPDFPDIEVTAAQADLREAAREYARLTASLRLVHPHFTDKSLQNFLYIGLIRMMLPEAKVVHLRRHPLASALGIYRQRFTRGIAYSFDLEHIIRHYRAYARLMQHWRETTPETFIEVYYETLVAQPERELNRILEYVGLEFEPACLEFYRLERPVRTASVTQVRQPLDRRGVERHERYRELLAPVAEALAEDITAYEKELADAGSPVAWGAGGDSEAATADE